MACMAPAVVQLVKMLTRSRTRVDNIRHEMNPGFGGIHPEPIAQNLGYLMSYIQSGHYDVGLATMGMPIVLVRLIHKAIL